MSAENFFLRFSASPNCNLRCVYCKPEHANPNMMSDTEIVETIRAAHKLGVNRVQYTGGESTLRTSLPDIIAEATKIGIQFQTLATNGVIFNRMASGYKEAGLTGVSISLDSLDRETVKQISGADVLDTVLGAIGQSCDLFPQVMLNTVVLPQNVDELPAFIGLAEKIGGGRLVPRFIELQNFGPALEKNSDLFKMNLVPETVIMERLNDIGPVEQVQKNAIETVNGHAGYFLIHGPEVVVGVIANYSHGWPCAGTDCGRIRVGPAGAIRSCVTGPTYQLSGQSYEKKLEILSTVIGEKDERITDNSFPSHHKPAYKTLIFGME